MSSLSNFPARSVQAVKSLLKRNSAPETTVQLQNFHARANALGIKCMYLYGRFVRTPINLMAFKSRSHRRLEIGPGSERVRGFETVDLVWGPHVDFVADASTKLPFKSETFELVYASHVLEHIPWYSSVSTVKEWVRILKPSGHLEVWVPDGYKLAKLLCDIEDGRTRSEWQDGWRPFNYENDPYKWVNGRLLYGAITTYPSWHTALITPKSLQSIFRQAGMVDIEIMTTEDLRGIDHGWINLGVRGRKP